MTLKILKICRFRSRKCHLFVQIVTRKDTVLKKDCSHGRDTFSHLLRNAMHLLSPKSFSFQFSPNFLLTPFPFPSHFLSTFLRFPSLLSLPFLCLFSASKMPYLVFTSYLSRISNRRYIQDIYKKNRRKIRQKKKVRQYLLFEWVVMRGE